MSIDEIKLQNLREYIGDLYVKLNARLDKIETQVEANCERLFKDTDKITLIKRDLDYFKNASNRHEEILTEFKDTIDSLRERNNGLSVEIIRLKARIIALEEYCADNREDEEEEECEEEICPDCKATQIREEFDHQQQELKAYVRTLGAALKNVSQALEALERA